jgi:hypothetical protein
MNEKAYVVVDGMTHLPIIRVLLPTDLRGEVSLTPAGDRSNPVSIARTLLVMHRRPVALLVDTRSVDEGIISEKRQITLELLKAAAAGIPVRVILLIPSIEALFFAAEGFLSRVFRQPLSELVRLLARSSPKDALEWLFAHSSGPKSIKELLDGLDDEAIRALRATPPMTELINFLQETVKPQPAIP